MGWIVQTVTRSIGKKQCVALTGIALCLFLVAHLLGNLLFYSGPEAFNGYAKALANSHILPFAEFGLFLVFLTHIILALYATLENWRARPVGYTWKRWEGGKTIGSSTMWITGPIILVFVIIHLANFRLSQPEGVTLFDLVMGTFRSLPYAVGYTVAMLVVGLHVSHGFQSVFRSLGLVHPKYMPVVARLGWFFAIAVIVGFSSIPLWIHFLMETSA